MRVGKDIQCLTQLISFSWKKHSIAFCGLLPGKAVMNTGWFYVMEVKLFRAQYSVSRIQEVWEETNNILLIHKGREKGEPVVRGLVYMHPSVSCEWKRGTGRQKERERDRKSTQGSNDNKQITQERRSLWTFPVRKSAFFSWARSLFPLTFFFISTAPPFSPEISFQHAKPCKNRPRVFKLRPVRKDVPACYTASGYCCSGPHVPLVVCPQFIFIVAAIIKREMQHTKLTNEEPDVMGRL